MNQPISDDDMVSVPRGLLGAARYAIRNKKDAPNVYAQLGDYAYRNGTQAADIPDPVDDAIDTVTADRDIKAANLQLLVDKVLAWEVRDSSFQLAPEVEPQFNEMIELARGLKQ